MSLDIPIPFLDLAAEISALRPEIDAAIGRVLDSGRLQLGKELEAFEREFAEYNGVAETVGVASGLAALKLMLQAFGIGPGDEVIVPTNTFIATWLAVTQVGAKPVPVEPDFHTRNLDPSRLEDALTDRTRAVLAVHLYGSPCDMNTLRGFCDPHGLLLLIDAAQSCGAEWKGQRSACLGDAAAFSFYPTKNLGSLGDAGAVATNLQDIADKIRLLRNYGMKDRYHHSLKGENFRLEELHAAVLRVKLHHLDEQNARRRWLAKIYQEQLAGIESLAVQKVLPETTPVWHLFTITTAGRDQLAGILRSQGIETLVHYPVPPHLSEAFRRELGPEAEFPIAENLSNSILSLPLYPSLQEKEVFRVCSVIAKIQDTEKA